MNSSHPSVAVTLGDSGGLGPELAVRCLTGADNPAPGARILVLGHSEALAYHSMMLGVESYFTVLDDPAEITSRPPGLYLYMPDDLRGLPFEAGEATVAGGKAAGACLELAASLAMDRVVGGLVTGPLNKAMLKAAGYDFPGHTEFLAEKSGVGQDNICMHLCGPKLRVSLVTTHPPLAQVPSLITPKRIMTCMRLTAGFVRGLGLDAPVAVCGLNPHAGESGTIGTEEITSITPTIKNAQAQGLPVEGPFPADTVFHQAASGRYSAVLAMYHDQGLGPLKLLHFGDAVNVTLGLPFVRTSVDHGTGYDLVGTGEASTSSFVRALELALGMIRP